MKATLNLSFAAEAIATPTGKRKPRAIGLICSKQLNIPVLEELKVAASWKRYLDSDVSEVMTDGNLFYSKIDSFESWKEKMERQYNVDKSSLWRYGDLAYNLSDFATYNWPIQTDNISAMEQIMLANFAGCVVFNGDVYVNTREPIFYVQTFGLGSNHGSTGVFIGYPNSLIGFNLKDYDSFIDYAVSVAINRRDTKSIDSIKLLSKPVIHIPEVFVYNRKQAMINDGECFLDITNQKGELVFSENVTRLLDDYEPHFIFRLMLSELGVDQETLDDFASLVVEKMGHDINEFCGASFKLVGFQGYIENNRKGIAPYFFE